MVWEVKVTPVRVCHPVRNSATCTTLGAFQHIRECTMIIFDSFMPQGLLNPTRGRLSRRKLAAAAVGRTSFQQRDVLPVPAKIITIGKPVRGPAQELAGKPSLHVTNVGKYCCRIIKGGPQSGVMATKLRPKALRVQFKNWHQKPSWQSDTSHSPCRRMGRQGEAIHWP